MKTKNIDSRKQVTLLALLVVILMVLMLFLGTMGNENVVMAQTSKPEYNFISPQLAQMIAEKFGKQTYGKDVDIVECSPVYNMDESFFGYDLRFETDQYSDVITIMDTNQSNLIIYSFTLNTLKDDTNLKTKKIKIPKEIKKEKKYLISPFTTAAQINGTQVLVDGKKYNKNQFKKFKQSTFSNYSSSDLVKDSFFSYDGWYNDKPFTLNTHYITNAYHFYPVTASQLNSDPNVGNCGPTAAYNILEYYDSRMNYNIFGNKSQAEVYNKLVEYMGKEDSTTIYQMATGVVNYIKKETPHNASCIHYTPPMWSYFKNDLNNNNPIIYCVPDHAMSVFGYVEIKEDTWFFPQTAHFLTVASGWTNDLKYTNFDMIDWKLGCVIKIS